LGANRFRFGDLLVHCRARGREEDVGVHVST
jgi:hypothetical protein